MGSGWPKFGVVYHRKTIKIVDVKDTSHSEAKPLQNLTKLSVATQKVSVAELKVGGATAPPNL